MNRKVFLMTAMFWLIQMISSAQLTMDFQDPWLLHQSGSDLMEKEKYHAAREVYQQILLVVEDPQHPLRVEAEFNIALCSYELLNNDARGLLTRFISMYPESNKVPKAWFLTGNTYFRDKSYRKAADAYQQVHSERLDSAELQVYWFRLGYSHFMNDSTQQARAAFMKIKDREGEYQKPALFYYSHISYSEGQYEVALAGFKALMGDENFGTVVPYYIAQIYYLQGKYDDLTAFAPPMLENPDVKRAAEMARMTGDAFYAKKDYANARKYFDMFASKTTNPLTREDYYLFGFTCYQLADYAGAARNFSLVSSLDDSLNQNTSYHLADCYLKTGNKKFALNSFYDAYRLSFNALITEDALFNYARLSYELDFHPYNGAIKALQQYLNDFPASLRAEEARELLADLLVSTGNYKDAIKVIESIKVKTDRIWTAYQKVNYYHGIELFNSGQHAEAIVLFGRAVSYNYDRSIRAGALFWKAESYYRRAGWDSAAACYDMFVKYPPAEQLPLYARGFYGLGYARMQLKNYSGAASSFELYFKHGEKDDRVFRNDASLRLADCYYILRKWDQSIEWYDKSLALNVENLDYALLQKSKCEGVQGNYKAKQNTLSILFTKYPKSAFADDAYYESGINHEIQNQNDQALAAYDALIVNHPGSPLRAQAMMKKGSIYRLMGESDKAINVFRQLVDEYEGTEESKKAWMNLKAIYTDIGKPDEFFNLVASQGSSLPEMEKDSMLYQSAENKYMDGDCVASVDGFTRYLDAFPNGAFRVNAYFYRSECQYGNKEYEQALVGYEYVISQEQNDFTKTSLLKAARIHYNNKQYAKAIDFYTRLEAITESVSEKLEAQRNIMNATFSNGQFSEAILAAQRFQENTSIQAQEKDEATAVMARSAYQLNDMARAQNEFIKLSKLKSSALGAEANYYLALIEYHNGNYTESEKRVFDLINEYASFEFWVAKSFILLSDVYVATNNFYQAKYALQSVIDNYEGEDLRNEAQQKLNSIIELERENEKNSNGEGEIIINGNNE